MGIAPVYSDQFDRIHNSINRKYCVSTLNGGKFISTIIFSNLSFMQLYSDIRNHFLDPVHNPLCTRPSTYSPNTGKVKCHILYHFVFLPAFSLLFPSFGHSSLLQGLHRPRPTILQSVLILQKTDLSAPLELSSQKKQPPPFI